jgi:hypothetical protein
MKRIALAVAAVTLLTAGASFATEPQPQPVNQGGVKITGDASINTSNNYNTNYADGSNNKAVQVNGSIVGDVEIDGSFDFNSYNDYNTNYATGSDNVAIQLNGSIVGANPFAE